MGDGRVMHRCHHECDAGLFQSFFNDFWTNHNVYTHLALYISRA